VVGRAGRRVSGQCWALRLDVPACSCLLVLEVAGRPGDPPAIHAIHGLRTAATPSLTLTSLRWSTTRQWAHRSWGEIAPVDIDPRTGR
jgi:hypothetical protein